MKALDKLGNYWSDHRAGALYTASSVAKAGAQVIAGFFLVRYIAPGDLGFWNAVSVATTYAMFMQAGLLNGLTRELPFNLGAGNQQKADSMAGTTQTFTVLGCAAAAVTGLGALGFYRDGSERTLLSIAAVTVVVITTFYNGYLTITFRSKNSFFNLSAVQFITAALSIATIPMLCYWNYGGMLSRVVLLNVAGVALLFMVRPIRPGLTWDWKSFGELMATGLPIFVLSYIETSAATSDRLVLVKFGGVEEVGYYSLGMMIWQGLAIIPTSLTAYIYPRMTYRFGKGADLKQLWNSAFWATAAVFAITVPMIVVGWHLLPWLVPVFFPKYVPGIHAAQLLMWAALFFTATIGVNLLWSMKVWKYMIAYQVTSAVLKGLCPLAGAYLCSSALDGVAYGVVAAHAAAFLVGIGLTYAATHRPAAA